MSIPTLQSVLAQGQLIAPDTFDGISTRAAEHMGCKGALLSASALTHTVHGTPDEGTLSTSEMVWSFDILVCLPIYIQADEAVEAVAPTAE